MGRSVLLLLAGALLGVVATLVARPAADPEPGDTTRLSSELEALGAEVRALRELVERRRSPPPTSAASDAGEPLSLPADIAEQMTALRSELQKLAEHSEAQAAESRATLGKLEAGLQAVASGAEPMPGSLPESPPDLQQFDRINGRDEDELSDEHLLWTYEQVTDTYGRPTRIQPSPGGIGIKFHYDLPGGKTCIFWFKGGKVVRVIWA